MIYVSYHVYRMYESYARSMKYDLTEVVYRSIPFIGMNHRLRVQTKLRVRAVKVHRISHGISQTTPSRDQ